MQRKDAPASELRLDTGHSPWPALWEQLPQPVQKREDAMVIVAAHPVYVRTGSSADPTRLAKQLRDILSLREESQTALVVCAIDAHA